MNAFKSKTSLRWILQIPLLLCAMAAWGADGSSVDVLMSIQTLGVQVVGGANLINTAVLKNATTASSSTLRNTGNGFQDYSIRIASTTGTWTPVSTTPGSNQYRLRAVWHQFSTMFTTNTTAISNEVQTNDALTTTNQLSSDSVFFNDSETHSTTSVKGYNVPAGADRTLFLLIQGGANNSTGNAVLSHVNITASASP